MAIAVVPASPGCRACWSCLSVPSPLWGDPCRGGGGWPFTPVGSALTQMLGGVLPGATVTVSRLSGAAPLLSWHALCRGAFLVSACLVAPPRWRSSLALGRAVAALLSCYCGWVTPAGWVCARLTALCASSSFFLFLNFTGSVSYFHFSTQLIWKLYALFLFV